MTQTFIEEKVKEFGKLFTPEYRPNTAQALVYNSFQRQKNFFLQTFTEALAIQKGEIVKFILQQKDHRDPAKGITRLVDAHELVYWLQKQK